jgi:hypothetical protein
LENRLELDEDGSPVLFEFSQQFPAPLNFIMRGEAYPDNSLGGGLDLGFNSASMVKKIGDALETTTVESLIDILIQASKHEGWWKPEYHSYDWCEWMFVKRLHGFYQEAARKGKAVTVFMYS